MAYFRPPHFLLVPRYLVMSYTTVFGVMIGVQVLQGLTFALMWSSAMEHVHKIAPKELIVTILMVNSMMHFGICGLLGNVLGGIIFNRFVYTFFL